MEGDTIVFSRHSVMTLNINGLETTGEEAIKLNKPKHTILLDQAKRHQVGVVGLQEHHKEAFADLRVTDHELDAKFWDSSWLLQTRAHGSGRGMGLLWRTREWTYQRAYSLSPRILIVDLDDNEHVPYTFVTVHFHNDSV